VRSGIQKQKYRMKNEGAAFVGGVSGSLAGGVCAGGGYMLAVCSASVGWGILLASTVVGAE